MEEWFEPASKFVKGEELFDEVELIRLFVFAFKLERVEGGVDIIDEVDGHRRFILGEFDFRFGKSAELIGILKEGRIKEVLGPGWDFALEVAHDVEISLNVLCGLIERAFFEESVIRGKFHILADIDELIEFSEDFVSVVKGVVPLLETDEWAS